MNLTERQLVERLRRKALQAAQVGKGQLRLSKGIGDDCAVISAGRADLLVTTDFLLEGVHFRREWQLAQSIGYKVLARGLSDIAAMGGLPRFAFLSLALPKEIALRWVDDFFKGFFRLAGDHGVALAGGDVAASSGVLADIMVIGEAPTGAAVLRSGARAGDDIWVSGRLGGAARGLSLLRNRRRQRKASNHRSTRASAAELRALFWPDPRLEIGEELRKRKLATAMMDLSDGLSIDLSRLCEASGVAAVIEENAIPCAPGATMEQALHGGEDFELLFTVAARDSRRVPSRIAGVPLTRIGRIARPLRGVPQILLLSNGKRKPLPVGGFQHFQ